jgi:hypothetical protein
VLFSVAIRTLRFQALRDVVLVNCDAGEVEMSHLVVEPLPRNYHRWLCLCLRSLIEPFELFDSADDLEELVRRRETGIEERLGLNTDNVIQLLFADLHTHMFVCLPKCLFFLGANNTTVFNRSSFINELRAGGLLDFPDEEKEAALQFIMKIISCQSFHRMIETIQACQRFPIPLAFLVFQSPFLLRLSAVPGRILGLFLSSNFYAGTLS